MELWRNPGRSLSGLRPQSFQLLGNLTPGHHHTTPEPYTWPAPEPSLNLTLGLHQTTPKPPEPALNLMHQTIPEPPEPCSNLTPERPHPQTLSGLRPLSFQMFSGKTGPRPFTPDPPAPEPKPDRLREAAAPEEVHHRLPVRTEAASPARDPPRALFHVNTQPKKEKKGLAEMPSGPPVAMGRQAQILLLLGVSTNQNPSQRKKMRRAAGIRELPWLLRIRPPCKK